MNNINTIIFFIFLVIFSFLPLIIFYWFEKKRKTNKNSVSFYKIQIGKSSISLTGNALYKLIILFCSVMLFEWFVPVLPLTIILGLYTIVSIVNASKNLSSSSVSSNTQDILSSLSDMKAKLSNIQTHIEEMTVEIENRRIEVEEKQKLTESLDQDINIKLKESDEWNALTDGQKQLVINAASEALNKQSVSQKISIVIGSILLNLIATLIWALFGNPGRKELIDAITIFFKSLSQ